MSRGVRSKSRRSRAKCGFCRAIFVRIVFLLHAIWAVYLSTVITATPEWWYFAVGLLPLLLESIVTLKVHYGHEYLYFCPSIFFYSLCMFSPIWTIELHIGHNNRSMAEIGAHSSHTFVCYENPHNIRDHLKEVINSSTTQLPTVYSNSNDSYNTTQTPNVSSNHADQYFTNSPLNYTFVTRVTSQSATVSTESTSSTTPSFTSQLSLQPNNHSIEANYTTTIPLLNEYDHLQSQSSNRTPDNAEIFDEASASVDGIILELDANETAPFNQTETSIDEEKILIDSDASTVGREKRSLKKTQDLRCPPGFTLSYINTSYDVLTQLNLELQKYSTFYLQCTVQLLLLLLIIGRWALPKGHLTHYQLSQLLLVYFADAADIAEFFETLNDPNIVEDKLLCKIVLSCWSVSIARFSIVTAEKEMRDRRSTRPSVAAYFLPIFNSHRRRLPSCFDYITMEVIGITLNMLMQNAPYLGVRLYVIVQYQIVNYTNLFFAAKNMITIILMVYRLIAIFNSIARAKRAEKGYEIRSVVTQSLKVTGIPIIETTRKRHSVWIRPPTRVAGHKECNYHDREQSDQEDPSSDESAVEEIDSTTCPYNGFTYKKRPTTDSAVHLQIDNSLSSPIRESSHQSIALTVMNDHNDAEMDYN